MIEPFTSLTLTAEQVAVLLGYFRENGEPNRLKIYQLARDGVIPAAIQANRLGVRDWRWSRPQIEAWCA